MEPGKYYHIYNHANGAENLFRSNENYRFFLMRYVHFINPVATTYAYCLMPNHIHFLIRINTERELEETLGKFETFLKLEQRLSKQFSNLFSSYTQALNKSIKRKGSLFVPNFKRTEIMSDHQLTSVILYIHNNAIHHGFVKKLTEWPWSSYNTFLTDKRTFLKRNEVLSWFGNVEEFIKLHHVQ